MKFALISIALLVGSSFALAQTSFVTRFRGSGCPVSMKLSQTSSSGLQLTANGHSRVMRETRLHLVLSHTGQIEAFPAHIRSAEVTVHGYNSDKPRFELVQPGHATVARSMFVRFTPAGEGSAYSNFIVPGFTWTGWLEIDSLTYADGSSWKPAAGESCTVIPGALRLIQ